MFWSCARLSREGQRADQGPWLASNCALRPTEAFVLSIDLLRRVRWKSIAAVAGWRRPGAPARASHHNADGDVFIHPAHETNRW